MRTERISLTHYTWMSLISALLTVGLKSAAYWITGSVGLLSDALESIVNFVAALIALIALTIAAQPPDDEHAYGHTKVEYFSSGAEGALIVIASVTIIVTALRRFARPEPLHQIDYGLAVSIVAALVNLVVARVLLRAGRAHRSVVLEADAHHLLTDVYTTAGVLIGLVAVLVTGWNWLDPTIALIVAAHIMYVGLRLVRRSMLGLMDTSLPSSEVAQIEAILQSYATQGVSFHALRTRQGGVQRYMSVHIQVPGAWNVQRGHTLLEAIEAQIRKALFPILILTHLEPSEDPVSWADLPVDRAGDEGETDG